MAGVITDSFVPLPAPLYRQAAAEMLEELASAGHPVAPLAKADERVANVLLAVFGASPFLTRIIRQQPDFAAECFSADSNLLFSRIIAEVNQLPMTAGGQKELMRELRLVRQRAALLIALADIAQAWRLPTVTGNLTIFADAAISAALAFLLQQGEAQGRLAHANPAECGLVVFSMGKGGAFELNYSSDVDLVFFFDPARAPLREGEDAQTFFTRLVRRLVQILSDITGEGQVMRVDLRLRPDPGSTPVAMPVEAALTYYYSIGQTWERAAWIKGRPCAGDISVGEMFLQELSPWLWRKYLDYAAIAEVHALKRRIHAVKGHGAITVPGHNLKLGRGGIREIEFFVQTQQLIAGGRNPRLRGRKTLEMLHVLADEGWIEERVAVELDEAYVNLRTWEHRLQMQNDLQTHTLPSSEEELERFARFAGFTNRADMEREVRDTLETVQGHYDALFAKAAEAEEEADWLNALLAEEPGEEALEILARLGFERPGVVAETVRGWFGGRYAALRSQAGKERLRNLLPKLLRAMAETGEADAALATFDRFLAGAPSGLQLFALLQANPHLMDLLLLILGSAPALAEELTRRPRLFEALIEGELTGSLPTREEHAKALADFAALSLPFEEVLDRARIHVSDQKFVIGTRLIAETADEREAEAAYTALAEAALAHMLQATQQEMVRRHGEVPNSTSAILAMGKLGSREMTHTSDLDLIVIHDFPPEVESSRPTRAQKEAGVRIRPLTPSEWFTRLTKRLITALTAPTAEGVLYEVDMRLRPSGSQGPVATHIESFARYQREQAWLWEHLALTRARAVAGDGELCARISDIVRQTITRQRDATKVFAAAADMRARILKEKPPASTWDVKTGEGGLIDVEFIAQALTLAHAYAHPDIVRQNTHEVLLALIERELLESAVGDALLRATSLYHRVMHAQRLCLRPGEKPREEKLSKGAARILARAAQAPDLDHARVVIEEMRREVAEVFSRIMAAEAE